jgi:hypothetical protein
MNMVFDKIGEGGVLQKSLSACACTRAAHLLGCGRGTKNSFLDLLAVNSPLQPLTTEEIAEAKWADASVKHLFKCNAVINQGLEIKLIENTTCVYKDGRLVIPKPLQVCAVKWYHYYLQHPGHTPLKETMNALMY